MSTGDDDFQFELFDTYFAGTPAATTPLAGTEPMLVFQGGTTKQVPANSVGIARGITPIVGGTDTCILFDKAGVIGEDTNLEWIYGSASLNITGLFSAQAGTLALQSSSSLAPVLNFLGFNGGWQIGVDVANAPGSRDLAISRGSGTFPNYNSSVGDFIYLSHNGLSLPPTLGIAYTPPPTGYTMAISPFDSQPTWGNILLRMGPSQTGDIITLKASGGSTIWRMTASGSSNFMTMSGTVFQDLGTGVPIQLFNSGATYAYSLGFNSSGAGNHFWLRSVTNGFNVFDIDAAGGTFSLQVGSSNVLNFGIDQGSTWSAGGFTGGFGFLASFFAAITTTTNTPAYRVKLNTDGFYRIVLGLDGSDNPNLGLGPGNNVNDVFLNRQSAGVFGVGTSTTNTGGSLKLTDLYTNDASFLIRTGTTLNNGAGTGTGVTFTNAPGSSAVTGNPTKWIPIDDNGTTRYVPAF